MSQYRSLIDTAETRISTAENRGALTATEANMLRSRVDRLRQTLIDADAEISQAGGSERLVHSARRELAQEAFDKAEAAAAGHLTDVQDRLEAIRSRLEDRAVPAPPTDDVAALEAKLANTRQDAQLAMSGVEERNLVTGLQDLAEDGDAFMRFLLLGTPWATYFLRSRRQGEAVIGLWKHSQRDLMALVADEDGMKAVRRLEAWKPAQDVPLLLLHAVDMWKQAALGAFHRAA